MKTSADESIQDKLSAFWLVILHIREIIIIVAELNLACERAGLFS
jgi:hypothetical protein